MLPALIWTLSEILVKGTSLAGAEQLDFNHPGALRENRPVLNLFCYDLNGCKGKSKTGVVWFEVCFLITAWDWTALGEQQLLSEVLALMLQHRPLAEVLLAESLRGHGNLPLSVASNRTFSSASLWAALRVPLRPAVLLNVSVPVNAVGQGEFRHTSKEHLSVSNKPG
jgi:hypothetical protein